MLTNCVHCVYCSQAFCNDIWLLCTILDCCCARYERSSKKNRFIQQLAFTFITFCDIEEAHCVDTKNENRKNKKRKETQKAPKTHWQIFSIKTFFLYSQEICLCNRLRFGDNSPNGNNRAETEEEKCDIHLNFQTQEVNHCEQVYKLAYLCACLLARPNVCVFGLCV